MSKLFVRLFQVVCLIHFAGVGQLHADADNYSSSADHISLTGTNHMADLTDQSSVCTVWYSFHGQKMSRLVAIDIDEEEYEPVSSKKVIEGNSCISDYFSVALPDYLHNNHKNSLAFCKQLSFISVSNRNLVFGIFRI